MDKLQILGALFPLPHFSELLPSDETYMSSSRSWELYFRCLTSVNCYPLMRLTRRCETSQNPLCCSQLSVIMEKDKVITLGPNELPNLVSSYRFDDRNYLQWVQYIRTTLKERKKLSHIEGKIGESYLEVKHVIESLPFPTQDVQVQEVTKPTRVLEQVQMSEPDVSILNNSIEEQVQLSKPETYGIDYEETFALLAKMNTIRVIISLTAYFGWNLQQFDVKNAFLHGDLEEEVYMEIPPGFYSHNKNRVCRLKKALYGLKQSPRAWFGRLVQVMISLGYKQSQGDDEIEKLTLKEKLATRFEMKELGKLKYFLGIEVAYSKQDIAYAVSVVSQFMYDPRERHLQVVERILHYLKASPGKGLLFRKEGTLSMEIYTDANYAGSVVDRRSTSRYCMFLGGNLVTWRSKKQNVVARSSVEAKF
ncbi:hypothetical protein CR513_29072, partial [Mucuna pruriens]